jgi:hypothetical protein
VLVLVLLLLLEVVLAAVSLRRNKARDSQVHPSRLYINKSNSRV